VVAGFRLYQTFAGTRRSTSEEARRRQTLAQKRTTRHRQLSRASTLQQPCSIARLYPLHDILDRLYTYTPF
jgi:hypothetical protein